MPLWACNTLSDDVRILGEPAWEPKRRGQGTVSATCRRKSTYPWMKIRQITAYTGSFLSQVEQGPCRTAAARMGAEPGRPRRAIVGWPDAKAGHHPEPSVMSRIFAGPRRACRQLGSRGRWRQFLATLLAMVGERTVLFNAKICLVPGCAAPTASRSSGRRQDRLQQRTGCSLRTALKRLHVQAAAALEPISSCRVPGMLHAKVTGIEAVVSVQDFTADLPERIAQQWASVLPHYRKKHLLVTTAHRIVFLAIPMFTMEFCGNKRHHADERCRDLPDLLGGGIVDAAPSGPGRRRRSGCPTSLGQRQGTFPTGFPSSSHRRGQAFPTMDTPATKSSNGVLSRPDCSPANSNPASGSRKPLATTTLNFFETTARIPLATRIERLTS